MTSTRIVLNYRRGRLFTSFHHRPFIISQNSVSVIRSTTATTCIRCSSSGIVRRHLSNIDDSNSGYYSLCLMPHSVCSGWGESIFGNRSFLLKRWMVTKRQQRIEEMKSQPQGTTTATDVGHSMDVDERLRKASVLAKADELEEGFAVDTSGLYQRNMHNFLPDFNDPKLNYEEATPLFDELSNIIGLRGPISVAEYFRYALLHPTHGYYTAPPSPLESSSIDDDIDNSVVGKYDLIGARGDFTTAPEISQIFGELLCVWFVHEWRQSGKKSPLQLIELGPGNGTLMSDMLRVARTSFPDFTKALSKKGGGIRLVEQSPALRKAQAKKLGVKDLEYETLYETNPDDPESNLNEITSIEYALSGSIPLHEENMSNGKPSIPITWHVSLASVPNDPLDGPQYVLAQELFDALPVHSFQKTKSGWRERLIDLASTEIDDDEASMEEKVEIPSLGLDENGKPIKKPRFRFVLSPGTTKAVRVLLNTDDSGQIKGDNAMQDDAAPGDILEVCPEGMSLVQDIAKRINKVYMCHHMLDRNLKSRFICLIYIYVIFSSVRWRCLSHRLWIDNWNRGHNSRF